MVTGLLDTMAMQTVIIARNPLEPETWVKHETSDIRELLVSEFNEWPSTARIYHEQVAVENDVTPRCEADVEALPNYEGKLYVIVYPGDPLSIIIAVVAAVAVAATMFLFRPAMPNMNRNVSSSNNSLTDRSNVARPNKRIPDIFGTVRSVPDLLTVPYKIFRANREVELVYFCIGRGEHEITDIKDDTTLASSISGMSVEVYSPNTSPLSGDSPQLTIGSAITDTLVNVKKSSQVNGQTLNAPNFKSIQGFSNIRFLYPNQLRRSTDSISLADIFEPGDIITISGDTVYSGLNLAGTYTVTGSDKKRIYLDNPAGVNSDWNGLNALHNNWTPGMSPLLAVAGLNPNVGPFDVDLDLDGKIVINFVGLQGLFKDNGKNQQAASVLIQTTVTPLDADNNEIGTPAIFLNTITGSPITRSQVGLTVEITPPFQNKVRISCKRLTNIDRDYDGQVVDEVKIRDLYITNPISVLEFGNVTTAYALTYATEGALAVKDRKLNMLATRLVPERVSGSTFTTPYASANAADIICAIATDPYIGNRDISELDVTQIYDTLAQVLNYFDLGADPTEFCYTFDDDQISFEETIQTIAQAVFCQAYRVGSVMRLSFEKQTNDSVLLFNHRNKIPGSEKRTITFGRGSNYDGIEYTYVDPLDSAIVTFYIPADRSAVNPNKIESIGIRNLNQAYLHAWRAWNKILYQTTVVEFEATQEADLLILQDRILVADNTRADTQDGEVVEQDGLELTLSQPVNFAMGVTYNILLQHVNATIESIPISAGSEDNKVILSGAPSASLSLDINNFARATYQIVGNTDASNTPFLLTEKDPQSNFTCQLRAINYDDRYYLNDEKSNHLIDFSATTVSWDNVCLTWDNDDGLYTLCAPNIDWYDDWNFIGTSSTVWSLQMIDEIGAGELLMIAVSSNSVATGPVGWSTLFNVDHPSKSNLHAAIFWKIADGTESLDFFDVTFASGTAGSWEIFEVLNCNSPPEFEIAYGNGDWDSPNISPSWGNNSYSLFVTAAFNFRELVIDEPGTPPSGYDFFNWSYGIASGVGAGLSLAKKVDAAFDENPGVFRTASGDNSDYSINVTLAIQSQ